MPPTPHGAACGGKGPAPPPAYVPGLLQGKHGLGSVYGFCLISPPPENKFSLACFLSLQVDQFSGPRVVQSHLCLERDRGTPGAWQKEFIIVGMGVPATPGHNPRLAPPCGGDIASWVGGTEMQIRVGRLTFLLTLAAVLMLGAAVPGQAAFTKMYKFANATGVSQSSVRATTMGLESVTAYWVAPTSWDLSGVGYAVVSGVYCTTISYGGPARAPGKEVYIAWKTSDDSCRLRDLRWGGGQTVVPTQLKGAPGGGMVFYDYPSAGCLTVVITNDLSTPGEVIDLSQVEFAVAGYELSLEELAALGDLVELRVADIDADIDALLADILLHAEELPSPSVNSLCKKMERAVAYKHEGLTEYLAGDLDGALVFWAKSAKQVTNFISEVTAAAQKGNLALDLYNRWVVYGGEGIVPAPEIRDALLALPEGQALQSLDPLPCGALPAYPGLDPADCVEWPVDELQPGEFTAFVVCNLDLGAGFIMGGSVLDEDGNVVLEWLEQSVAEPGVIDDEPPVITATPAYLWPPDHELVEMALDVTVTDNSGYAVWFVVGVESNQPESGTGDGDHAPDWVLDPDDPQSVWLRAERSANHPEDVRIYTITLMAIDMAGNLSAPYYLEVRVDHDQGT